MIEEWYVTMRGFLYKHMDGEVQKNETNVQRACVETCMKQQLMLLHMLLHNFRQVSITLQQGLLSEINICDQI